jgi:hypothetical protein
MINNDSIVTAYDEHLTLVEWLQKVEKLLVNGNLKSIVLNDKGNATFSLTLTFNDDTTITSPDMTLTSVNEALTALTGDVSRIDGSINQLNINFQALDNSVDDIKDGTTHLFENITDRNGNKRFIEGNITMEAIEGVTQTFGKWSLSGTHLMIALVGELSAGYTLPAIIARNIVLPSWIRNKIVHISGDVVSYSHMLIARKSTSGGNPTADNIDTSLLDWITVYGIIVTQQPAKDYDRVFRVQFDLLIDNE